MSDTKCDSRYLVQVRLLVTNQVCNFLKLELFSLCDAYASPKLIGSCKCIEGDTCAKLIPLLEGIFIVDWPFQFFDIESRCKINYKLEGLHRAFSYVYILPLVDPNLESRKRMRAVGLDFVSNSQQTLEWIAKEVEIQDLTH